MNTYKVSVHDCTKHNELITEQHFNSIEEAVNWAVDEIMGSGWVNWSASQFESFRKHFKKEKQFIIEDTNELYKLTEEIRPGFTPRALKNLMDQLCFQDKEVTVKNVAEGKEYSINCVEEEVVDGKIVSHIVIGEK